MVELKNIKKTNNQIMCDVFVEDCKEAIPLIYDITNNMFNGYALPDDYSYCTVHMGYAKRFLKALAEKKEAPASKLIMWY